MLTCFFFYVHPEHLFVYKMINVFSLTWLDYVFILAGLLALLYFYLTKNFNYFEKKGIPYEKPYPLLGSMGKLFLKKLDLYTFNERYIKD